MADTKRKPTVDPHREEITSAKRQRVSRACDQCRSAREKCDGIQPICFTCASSNRTCSYTANPKKRGIQPGYIRTLELTLAWIFSNVSQSEETLGTQLREPSLQSLLTGKDAEGSYKLHKRWRKSHVCKDIDRLLSGLDTQDEAQAPPIPPNNDANTDEESSNAHQSGTLKPKPSRRAENNGFTMLAPSLAAIDPAIYPEIRLPAQTSPVLPLPTHISATEKRLRLPTDFWSLIDLYFAYTHCWLPIAEKTDVLKNSYSYQVDTDGIGISSDDPQSADHAELWAILALASMHQRAYEAAQRYYSISRALIPSEDGAFSIGHVKALVLLGLYNTADQPDTAWILAGVAVRVALMLGLNHSNEQRSKHTFMACFMLDSFVSAQIGQLPHMRDGKLGKKLLDSDGLEEWQPWTGCVEVGTGQSTVSRSPAHSPSIFNCLVRISALLNDICCREEEQVALQATVRLQYWANSLPKSCHFSDQAGTTTPHLLNLRMAWSCLMLTFSDSNATAAADQVIMLFHAFGRHHSTAVYPVICASYLALCISRLEGKQVPQRTKDQIFALRSHLGIGQPSTEIPR